MLRLLVLVVAALGIAAMVAPGFREFLAWALAFLSALMLGDLLRSSLSKWRHRT